MSKIPKWKEQIILEMVSMSNKNLLDEAKCCSCQSCSKEEDERPIQAWNELESRLIAIGFIKKGDSQ